jgi:hypothetical protein
LAREVEVRQMVAIETDVPANNNVVAFLLKESKMEGRKKERN